MNQPRIGSLFSGYGGLEMGIQAAIDGDVAWYCENEPAAITVLQHHHPNIPNLGDITAVDWSQVEPVDVLAGGFPCTDVSSAGKRAGLRPGTRSGLWTHMAYAIAELRPALVVIENVRGLLSTDAHCDLEPCPWCLGDNEGRPLRALGAVLGDLATLGYVGRWHGLRAADIGAPHGRFRIFITAWPASHTDRVDSEGRASTGLERETRPAVRFTADPDGFGQVRGWGTWGRRSGPTDDGATAPDTNSAGRRSGSGMGRRTGPTTERNSASIVADTDCDAVWEQPEPINGCCGQTVAGQPRETTTNSSCCDESNQPVSGNDAPQPIGSVARTGDRPRSGSPAERVHELGRTPTLMEWGPYAPAIQRWERILGCPAPAPTLTGKRGGQQLSPGFVEWMQGLPQGWVTDTPGLSRNDQLKLLGNGVVPQQAAAALAWLLGCEECVA